MANITDKITETFNTQNPVSTTVTGSRSIGGTTLSCASLAGWPTNTAVHFATYQKDSTGAKVTGSQTDWKGIVSGSSINTLTQQGGAADGGNSVGDIVEMMPTYSWANDLAAGLEQTLNQDGTLKTGVVTSSKILDGTITGTDIAAATITGSNLAAATVDNSNLKSNISPANFSNPYKFSVYRNAGWTTAGSGVASIVQFDTKTFDTGSNVDIVTHIGRFTAPIAGFYFFHTSINMGNVSNTHNVRVEFLKNGSAAENGPWIPNGSGGTLGMVVNNNIFLSLSANDYIEVNAYGDGNSGGTGATNTCFSGFLVSAT